LVPLAASIAWFFFTRDGEVLWTRGGRGQAPEQFLSPADVAIFGNRIFVLDTGNNRVQIFELAIK
jgi:hypothetical protein